MRSWTRIRSSLSGKTASVYIPSLYRRACSRSTARGSEHRLGQGRIRFPPVSQEGIAPPCPAGFHPRRLNRRAFELAGRARPSPSQMRSDYPAALASVLWGEDEISAAGHPHWADRRAVPRDISRPPSCVVARRLLWDCASPAPSSTTCPDRCRIPENVPRAANSQNAARKRRSSSVGLAGYSSGELTDALRSATCLFRRSSSPSATPCSLR